MYANVRWRGLRRSEEVVPREGILVTEGPSRERSDADP